MKVLFVGLLLSVTGIQASPPPSEWTHLGQILGPGKLVTNIRPPAAPCHKASYDEVGCSLAVSNWQNSSWRSGQIGAMQFPIWEQLNGHWCDIAVNNVGQPTNSTEPIPSPCPQGNVPRFGVNASAPEDIVKAVSFAHRFSIPLIVKGTGHDLLGRSSEPNRLLIWTHNMKNITFGTTRICGTDNPDTLTVAAGVQWGEAYRALAQHQRVTPGGGDPDVGASGGQTMGGGHGPLSNIYGLTADNVMQFEVVTPDGVFRTVNRCTNQDLYWALRGGAGGTYAIVTSTTYKTYPDAPTAFVNLAYNSTPESYAKALDVLATYSAQLTEVGWTGYFFGLPGLVNGFFLLPLINVTLQDTIDIWTPIFKAFNDTEGLQYSSASVSLLPGAQAYLSGLVMPGMTGSSGATGSRLIPKALFQDPTTRANITNLLASLRNGPANAGSVVSVVAGGAPSHPSDSAILPAWRKAVWHFIVAAPFPIDAPKAAIEETFKALTDAIEPVRQATPGSGAYLGEADARAPAWKEDFFGENYDKLLTIKKKWDPKGLLHCNRCVGSDE